MQIIEKKVRLLKCDRCGLVWQPRLEQPVKCPRCGHRFDSARIYQTKKLRKVREAHTGKGTGSPQPSNPGG